uniref:U10-Theraphotoxin-Sfo1a_1 n=1 Tax=Selenotholus foelschei TaxID=1905327 RepID=A0A482ZDX0_9ARAC
MVMSFGVLLFLIFVIELGGGIAAYVYRNQFKELVRENMQNSIDQFDTKKDTAALWDEMQEKLKCCGVVGKSSYEKRGIIPGSCCGNNSKDDTCKPDNPKIYEQGCLDALQNFMQHKILMVGGAAVGVGIIELLGVIFACCLANAIKKEYEGV